MDFLPYRVAFNIVNHLFKYRDLELTSDKSKQAFMKKDVVDCDMVVALIETYKFLRIDAVRKNPRGERKNVIFLIIPSTINNSVNSYVNASGDMTSLINSIISPNKKELDEIILLLESKILLKKNIMGAIDTIFAETFYDAEGTHYIHSVINIEKLCVVVPLSKQVPNHRIMSAEEAKEFLKLSNTKLSSLPLIAENDSAIFWIGGKVGQLVSITRDSKSAIETEFVRKIVKPILTQ